MSHSSADPYGVINPALERISSACNRRRTTHDRAGFVYFILCCIGCDEGPVKVGWAYDVEQRLAQLQTANPYSLRLLGYFPGTVRDEKALQYVLRPFRMRGEWFSYRREIAEIAKSCAEIRRNARIAAPRLVREVPCA